MNCHHDIGNIMTLLRARSVVVRDISATGKTALLADAHSLRRDGLRQMLEVELRGCRIVEVDRLALAVACLREGPIDLLLLSLTLPGLQGPESLDTLRTIYPRLIIGVISDVADRKLAGRCLTAGADGFIFDQEPAEEIAFGISTMLAGRIYVTPSITNFGAAPTQVQAPPRLSGLTARQVEVLRLLAQGRSNKEIARILELSESTVKIHLAAVYRALRARNRTEAVVIAGGVRL